MRTGDWQQTITEQRLEVFSMLGKTPRTVMARGVKSVLLLFTPGGFTRK